VLQELDYGVVETGRDGEAGLRWGGGKEREGEREREREKS
jgi:hypothetical protein